MMRRKWGVLLAMFFLAAVALGQTADELVAKNIQAKGGLEKIKAIQSLRMHGRMSGAGGFTAQVGREQKRPDMLRQTFTLQGMTQVKAFDGSTGWQISPFQGRKDPEVLGEDDLRTVEELADFDGPLVDYQAKGNRVEYLGHSTVDGDDALRLKVTLKNGDIVYYFLDPETYLEIRVEKQQFIRGNIVELAANVGSYKQVAGVYFPFSSESGPKDNPSQWSKVTVERLEVNVPIEDAEFKMPAAPAVPSQQLPKK